MVFTRTPADVTSPENRLTIEIIKMPINRTLENGFLVELVTTYLRSKENRIGTSGLVSLQRLVRVLDPSSSRIGTSIRCGKTLDKCR